jgi:hypothetical protein
MTNSNINNLLTKFAAARLKRAVDVPRLSNQQIDERVRSSPNFPSFQRANPAVEGFGAPYYEGNDLMSGFRDTGYQNNVNSQGGPSYNFNQYQAAPWMSATGTFANPATNMLTGTSGSGWGTTLGAGAAGYLAGKGIQNFDLLRGARSAIYGRSPGAQESVVGRQIAPMGIMGQGFNPSNLPPGTQASFKPAGGGESKPLPGVTSSPGAAAPKGKAPPGPVYSPRSIAESLADRGFNPGGGTVVVQQPAAGPKGAVPAPRVFEAQPAGAKSTVRQALAPARAGGTSSAGIRGWAPAALAGGAMLASMAPNIYNAFTGHGLSPQAETGTGTLDAPNPEHGAIRSLFDADKLRSR